jgi:hypothetical protein
VPVSPAPVMHPAVPAGRELARTGA